MDQSNYRNILHLHRPGMSRAEVDLILNLVYPGENREVPDPYWDDDGFEQVYQLLHEATDRLLEEAMGKVD
jgi:protein-tyrosine phosphatase